MRDYKIYTCGKMGGWPYSKQMGWRREIDHAIVIRSKIPVKFFHPPIYYNFEVKRYKDENEIMEYDLAKLRECDILVVNLDGIESSIGSCFEIATANAMNNFGNKHIFIIGIGDEDSVHPWIKSSMSRCERDVDSAADYIATFLIT